MESTLKLTALRVIDSGTFGTVWQMYCEKAPSEWKLANPNVEGSTIAVKEMLLDVSFKGEPKELIMLRMASSSQGSGDGNQHIVKLFGAWRQHNGFYLCMEPGGRSLRCLYENGQTLRWSSQQKKNIFRGIMKGLQHLRSLAIIHRDIKPSNILVGPDSLHAKICDFGCALNFNHQNSESKRAPVICTLMYRAPELLFASPYYDYQVDTWSAACILGEMLTQRPFFFHARSEADLFFRFMLLLGTPTREALKDMRLEEVSDLMCEMIRNNYPLPSSLKCVLASEQIQEDKESTELLMSMLIYSPKVRLTTSEVLEHPWLAIVP